MWALGRHLSKIMAVGAQVKASERAGGRFVGSIRLAERFDGGFMGSSNTSEEISVISNSWLLQRAEQNSALELRTGPPAKISE